MRHGYIELRVRRKEPEKGGEKEVIGAPVRSRRGNAVSGQSI